MKNFNVRRATASDRDVALIAPMFDLYRQFYGKPADPNRRGYIVDPQDTLIIDGFRTSNSNVAAFRFNSSGNGWRKS